MATQVTLGSGVIDSASGLKLRTNGTTEAVDISTGQVATLAKDAVVNGLTVGRGAGAVSTNTAVGASALAANQAGGTNNTAIGNAALDANTTGDANTAVGDDALGANTTASNNTAVGYQAGYSNLTGERNTVVGSTAFKSGTGSFNTVVGDTAMRDGNAGQNNAAFGYGTLAACAGNFNTGLGSQALLSNTTASNNTAVGYQAGYNQTTGVNNTAVGSQAGFNVSTAGNNILIGMFAGGVTGINTALTTGNQNVLIGYGAGPSAAGGTLQVVIGGDYAVGKGNSTGFIAAGSGVFQGNNSSSWSTTSDRRLKKNIVDNDDGLEKITAIRVRNFEYRLPDEVDAELNPSDAIKKLGTQLGVIAQELQEVLPECVKQESTGVLTVDTDNLTWYLINAVKQLKSEIDILKGQP